MKLNSAIKQRWSPCRFSDKQVTKEMIELLFEAARLAPSARNEQPWRYYYTHRNDKNSFNKMTGLLTGNNPDWAKDAQVLIISVLKKNYEYKNRPNKNALHDLGAANMSIAIQAAEIGFQVHPMAGFDSEKAMELLNLKTEDYEAKVMFAVGFPDETEPYPDDTLQRIEQHQSRKDISELVFHLK
jgi:nitroreductase